jgi:hypothetical protein
MTKRLSEWDKMLLKIARDHHRELAKGRAIPTQKPRRAGSRPLASLPLK